MLDDKIHTSQIKTKRPKKIDIARATDNLRFRIVNILANKYVEVRALVRSTINKQKIASAENYEHH